jgi:hypothetical protein
MLNMHIDITLFAADTMNTGQHPHIILGQCNVLSVCNQVQLFRLSALVWLNPPEINYYWWRKDRSKQVLCQECSYVS